MTEKQIVEMREALRQAIDEEMTRDYRVFIMGEEVAEYNGAYKVTKGMLDKWGPERVIDTPIAENGFAGYAIGAAHDGPKAHCRIHELELFLCGGRSTISNACKMYYMSGSRFQSSYCLPRTEWRCRTSFQPALPLRGSHLRQSSWLYRHRPQQSLRCQRAPQIGHPLTITL